MAFSSRSLTPVTDVVIGSVLTQLPYVLDTTQMALQQPNYAALAQHLAGVVQEVQFIPNAPIANMANVPNQLAQIQQQLAQMQQQLNRVEGKLNEL